MPDAPREGEMMHTDGQRSCDACGALSDALQVVTISTKGRVVKIDLCLSACSLVRAVHRAQVRWEELHPRAEADKARYVAQQKARKP